MNKACIVIIMNRIFHRDMIKRRLFMKTELQTDEQGVE